MSKNSAPPPAAQSAPTSVTLDSPLTYGDQTVTQVDVRKPAAGELRGASLSDLLQLDVSALLVVLPRVTTPMLTAQHLAQLDPADLVQLGGAVAAFLLPKAAREAASLPA